MPKIITTKTEVFKFSELSENGKQKAVENLRDINTNYDGWDEPAREDFTEKMKEKGFAIDKIYYSGFWSQGDGACFEGEMKDLKKYLGKSEQKKFKKAVKLLDEGFLTVITKQRGNYSHENCMHVEMDDYSPDEESLTNKEFNELEEFLTEALREQARELYKSLENDFSDLSSDEAIIETIESNDYDFTSDGKLF